MKPFSSHKALWFKEWRQQQIYLLPTIILFSVSPLMYIFASDTSTGVLFRENILTIHLRGPGIMMLVVSLGLAILTIRLDFRDGGIQVGSEPIGRIPLLIIKGIVGLFILVLSQTVVAIWVGVALFGRHALFPDSILQHWWLISTAFEISCYTFCFGCSLLVRKWIACAVYTVVGLLVPLYFGQLIERLLFNHVTALGEQMLAVPMHTLAVVSGLSPFWYLQYGPIFSSESVYMTHMGELSLWPLLGLCTVFLFGNRVNAVQTHARATWRWFTTLRSAFMAFGTLVASILAQHFVLHIEIPSIPVRVVAVFLLWVCLFLALHSTWQMRAQRKAASHNLDAFDERRKLL